MDDFRMVFFYFLFYSFLGWIIEGLFNLCTRGTFIKPNFLNLPIKPMYGIASVLLIGLWQQLPFYLFVPCCFIVPAFVEYLSGFLLWHTFHLRYWDYHTQVYQLSGYVCLRFCIYWSILSFILIYFVQPYIANLYTKLSPLGFYFFPILLLIFLTDLLFTVRKRQHHI